MHILICSDGTDAADQPTQLGGLIAGPLQAEVTLLGIAEGAQDEAALREALRSEAGSLGGLGVTPETVVRTGDPIEEILQQTKVAEYELVVIGARLKSRSGPYRRSRRMYEVIRSIAPPVLVASGRTERLAKILLCTGGKQYIETAVQLTGRIAAAAKATVTLLHVMAEPPAIYSGMVRLEEDVDTLLAEGSELGANLRAQRETLEKLGVAVEVRGRHGFVLEQILTELRTGDYDLVVAGSSRAEGAFQQYIMGDLTRSILNGADCPVLIARSGHGGGLWSAMKRLFSF